MPENRRRQPAPDPKDFTDPRTEKIYWATERLLDEAPPTGKLKWHNLYDGWQSATEEFVQRGETSDEAGAIAWNATFYFIGERLQDLRLEVTQHQFERLNQRQVIREGSILVAWANLAEEAQDKTSSQFSSEPPNPYLTLKDYPPTQLVEPGNPNSPIYGHLQALDAAIDLQPIPEQIAQAVVSFATRDQRMLSDAITSWNRHMQEIWDPETQDPQSIAKIRESLFMHLALIIAISWGSEGENFLSLDVLAEHIQAHRQDNHPFIDLLSMDTMEQRSAAIEEKHQTKKYVIKPRTLKKATEMRVHRIKNSQETTVTGYAAELSGYQGLDFGVVVVWGPTESRWIGSLMISQTDHNPPRKTSGMVQLVNANTPAQAIAGMFDYLRENADTIELPYRTELSKHHLNRALRLLAKERDIYPLG